MNERYIFRGKRKDNGAWMQGSLVSFPDDNEHYGIWSENAQSYLWVEPATVGQCTGIKDRRGKLIFEGDMLHSDDMLKYCECKDDEKFAVVRGDGKFNACFTGDMRTTCYNMKAPKFHEREIIGNIHDNSELLEVSVA